MANFSAEEFRDLEKINKLLLQEKFGKIISVTPALIKKYKDQVFFKIALSIAYSKTDEPEKALNILLEEEKKSDDSYDIKFQIGKIYEILEDYNNAIFYFEKSYEKTPLKYKDSRADCLNDIGAMYDVLGLEHKAEEYWRKALEIDPAHENAKLNLKSIDSESSEEDLEISEFIKEEIYLLAAVQREKYLYSKNKKKFSSEIEENNFLRHIEAAFINIFFPEIDKIIEMPDDLREEMYENTEIDFTSPLPEIMLPETKDGFSDQVKERFSFLPENGFLQILTAMPAIEYAGLSFDNVQKFIAGDLEFSDKEKLILKWAYEIGSIITKFGTYNDKKKAEAELGKLKKLLDEKLNEDDAVIVLHKLVKFIRG